MRSTRSVKQMRMGKPFDGADRYVMHFPAGQLPPVDGFWSLTMYDDQYFFVPNKLNRYTLSARNALKHNADGSVDLYLQASDPGPAKEANWLPTTTSGKFIPMLRLYWPKRDAALDPRRHLETAADPENDRTVGNRCRIEESSGANGSDRNVRCPPDTAVY